MGNAQSVQTNLRLVIISNKHDAQRFLDSAEKEDSYLEECYDDRANMVARRNLTYNTNTISVKDTDYAISYLDSIYSALSTRLVTELNEVKIIQLMPTADGGMPHTRPGDIICYPDISQLFSKITLIHELWHIHQRKFKNIWFKAFKRIGWTVWNDELPEQLENNRRYNPDTIDSPYWIFNETWVPIPIFKNITRPNVSDVEIWFYNPENNYHIKRVPPELATYFPDLPPSAYEHPREITAYMLSEPIKYSNSQGFKHLIESIGHISIMSSENVPN